MCQFGGSIRRLKLGRSLLQNMEKRPRLWTAAIVTVALALSYENVVFRGHTLVASANNHPFDNRFTHLNARTTRETPSVNWHDVGAAWWQWEPAGRFFARAYQRGRLPLWDSSLAGGVDAHVNVTQTQYFPPYILLLLSGDSPVARDLYYLVLLWVSALACSALALRNDLHPLSAAAMGIIYALGGAMTQTINSMIGQSFATIPVVVLACDWLLRHPSWKRAAGLALVVASSILSGFIPAVITGLMLLPLMLLSYSLAGYPADPASRWRRVRRSVLTFSVAIALGIAAAAFLLLPLYLASETTPEFRSWYGVKAIGLQNYDWLDLPPLISPRLTYDVWQNFDPSRHLFPHPKADVFYLGLMTLLLMTLARQSETPRARQFFLFCLVASVFVFLKLVGVPPVQRLGSLPILKHIHFIPYACAAFNLGIAGLAAFGIEALVRKPAKKIRAGRTLMAAGFILVALFLFLSVVEINPAANWRMNLLDFSRLLLLSFVLLGVITARSRGRISGPAAGAVALGLAFLDLSWLAHHPRYGRADVWNEVPSYVGFLQQDRSYFRIHAVHHVAITPNVNQALGLDGLSSRHVFIPTRYSALIRKYFEVSPVPFSIVRSLLPAERRVLDLLNVKYLITASSEEAASLDPETDGLRRVLEDGTFELHLNPTAWPRAYLASTVQLVSSKDQALEAIGRLAAGTAVLEKRPLHVRPMHPAAGSGEVVIEDYGPNRIRLMTRSPHAAILVLAENYSPGWTATVNHEPTEVYIANYAFRAVEVPAGQATVIFRYRPPGLAAGILISAASLLAIMIMIVAAVFREKRRPVVETVRVSS